MGSIDAGDYMLYHNIYVKEAGTYQFRLRVASNNTDGGVEGSPDGVTIVTTAAPEGVVGTVPFTGDWQSYTDVYLNVPLDAGLQTIRFNATHEGWNINYFDIQAETKAVVTPEGVAKIEMCIRDRALCARKIFMSIKDFPEVFIQSLFQRRLPDL